MTIWTAVNSCFEKYSTFQGRASRSEYWYFFLFSLICAVLLQIADYSLGIVFWPIGFGYCSLGWFVITILPNISVTVRRLHDTNRSGWWYWLGAVPLVGGIILIVWACTKGTQGTNRFGPDPLNANPGNPAYSPAMVAAQYSSPTLNPYPDASKNYCVSCGEGMMPSFRLCPKCGGRIFRRGG